MLPPHPQTPVRPLVSTPSRTRRQGAPDRASGPRASPALRLERPDDLVRLVDDVLWSTVGSWPQCASGRPVPSHPVRGRPTDAGVRGRSRVDFTRTGPQDAAARVTVHVGHAPCPARAPGGARMRDSSARPRSDRALEHACQEVEATVSRVAKLVLHASALADRMETTAAADPHTAVQRRERVRLLRAAAEAGRRTISQVELVEPSGGAPVPAQTGSGPTAVAAPPAGPARTGRA